MKLSTLAISFVSTAGAALAQSPGPLGPLGPQPEPMTFFRVLFVMAGAVMFTALLAMLAFGSGGKRWERP